MIETSEHALPGTPPANIALSVDSFTYTADFIAYNYSCTWVAPQFRGFNDSITDAITDALWAVDDSGILLKFDTLSSDVGNEALFYNSLYGACNHRINGVD